jgi:hypothetical protein
LGSAGAAPDAVSASDKTRRHGATETSTDPCNQDVLALLRRHDVHFLALSSGNFGGPAIKNLFTLPIRPGPSNRRAGELASDASAIEPAGLAA